MSVLRTWSRMVRRNQVSGDNPPIGSSSIERPSGSYEMTVGAPMPATGAQSEEMAAPVPQASSTTLLVFRVAGSIGRLNRTAIAPMSVQTSVAPRNGFGLGIVDGSETWQVAFSMTIGKTGMGPVENCHAKPPAAAGAPQDARQAPSSQQVRPLPQIASPPASRQSRTWKFAPLESSVPAAVKVRTRAGPVTAPSGTEAVMLEDRHCPTDAAFTPSWKRTASGCWVMKAGRSAEETSPKPSP